MVVNEQFQQMIKIHDAIFSCRVCASDTQAKLGHIPQAEAEQEYYSSIGNKALAARVPN